MNVIDTGTNLVRVSILLEGREEFHVALGRLDGNHICIQTLNRREDIVEIRVTEVGMGLKLVADASSCELEGVDRPFQIVVPVGAAKG